MSKPGYVDGVLVDWGASLFNQRSKSAPSAKKSMTGVFLPPRRRAYGDAVGRDGVTADAKVIRRKLGSIVRRTPQVVVKISGGGKGIKHIKAHLDYISRNGELEVEDQSGEAIKGRKELNDLRNEWQDGGFQIAEESDKREAFNVILSMPKGTDPIAVKRAARDFAAAEFANHQYVLVLHTFDTDPDPEPSPNPHVHLCVKARSIDGVRLHPRKADLQRWREGFAHALGEHGIEAAATNRLQRLDRARGERLSVRQMRERGQTPSKIARSKAAADRVAKAKQAEATVLRGYREIVRALASSGDAEDRKLAVGISERIGGKLHDLGRDKSRDIER